MLLFLAGVLGGRILVFFRNRQRTAAPRRAVLTTFSLASPIALLMMLAGGLIGPLGVLIFPQIPWVLLAWLGSSVGKLIFRA